MSAVGKWAAAAWALPLSGVAASVWVSLAPVRAPALPSRRAVPVAPSAPVVYPADSLGERVVERDPFRTSRRPAAVAYDPAQAASASLPEVPPKPQLVLSGIVWGAVPEAVLDGLPGLDAPRVVHEGDVVAGLRIRRITRDRVVIAGMDTVWTLTVREPWQ